MHVHVPSKSKKEELLSESKKRKNFTFIKVEISGVLRVARCVDGH